MNKQKGFTIIELIVVIAIIAVLAAIVLVNVTQYINKGKDAAAQGNLASMLTNSAVWISSGNSTYAGYIASVTGGASYITALTNSSAGYTVTQAYTPTDDGFCASVVLKGTGTPNFCVDSSGKKGTYACTTSGTNQGTCQ